MGLDFDYGLSVPLLLLLLLLVPVVIPLVLTDHLHQLDHHQPTQFEEIPFKVLEFLLESYVLVHSQDEPFLNLNFLIKQLKNHFLTFSPTDLLGFVFLGLYELFDVSYFFHIFHHFVDFHVVLEDDSSEFGLLLPDKPLFCLTYRSGGTKT